MSDKKKDMFEKIFSKQGNNKQQVDKEELFNSVKKLIESFGSVLAEKLPKVADAYTYFVESFLDELRKQALLDGINFEEIEVDDVNIDSNTIAVVYDGKKKAYVIPEDIDSEVVKAFIRWIEKSKEKRKRA